MSEGTQLIRGLVVAAETKRCDLDGTNGQLAYGGYDIADLAKKTAADALRPRAAAQPDWIGGRNQLAQRLARGRETAST